MNFSDYVGIPFVEKGYDHEGVNCWGLVVLFKKEQMNQVLPTYEEFYNTSSDETLATLIPSESLKWDRVEREEPGDVVLIRINGNPTHVGIVVREGLMLHVEQGKSSVVESYKSPIWKNRIAGFYRYR